MALPGGIWVDFWTSLSPVEGFEYDEALTEYYYWQLEEEKMQVYVRLGIKLLYKGATSRMGGGRGLLFSLVCYFVFLLLIPL